VIALHYTVVGSFGVDNMSGFDGICVVREGVVDIFSSAANTSVWFAVLCVSGFMDVDTTQSRYHLILAVKFEVDGC
jgi:hypothetical protein